MQEKTSTLADIFTKLDGRRGQVMERARRCAELTIPCLLPPKGSDQNTPLPTPWQSFGARALNTLAAKLLLTMFPPNSPFWKLDVDASVIDKLRRKLGEDGLKTLIEEDMGAMEQVMLKYIEASPFRSVAFKIVRQCLVTGDVLIEMPPEGGINYYTLDQYVVRRSPRGKLLEVVIQEFLDISEVPASHKDVAMAKKKDDLVEMYSGYILRDGKWHFKQEIAGKTIEETEAEFPENLSPVFPLPWILNAKEHHGRGHVEEHIGDFNSLESFWQALTEGGLNMARILYLENPNGSTDGKEIETAPNGSVVTGSPDDISVLQVEKYPDLKFALECAIRLEDRLSRAFLLHEAVQRQGERVTAEEIRYMAQELEDALGGQYSHFAQNFQLPVVNRIMWQMRRAGKLPTLPASVTPTITTGFEALGRGHDLARLKGFLMDIAEFSPEILNTWLNPDNVISRMGTARGVDMKGMVKTPKQVQQEQAAAQQQALMNQVAGPIANQGTKGIMDAANSQGE